MYTDINGQTYKLEDNKAIIQQNKRSVKIEIFPTITFENKEYEVVFSDNCYNLFYNENLEEFTLHKLLHPTTNVNICKCMFMYCINLKSLDLTNFNTDNVIDMEYMFFECNSLSNLNNLNMINVINIIDMFYGCRSLKELTFNNLNIKLLKYYKIFKKCINLKQINIINKNPIIKIFPKIISRMCSSYCFNNESIIKIIMTLCEYNNKDDIILNVDNSVVIKTIISNGHTDDCMYDINCNNSYVK